MVIVTAESYCPTVSSLPLKNYCRIHICTVKVYPQLPHSSVPPGKDKGHLCRCSSKAGPPGDAARSPPTTATTGVWLSETETYTTYTSSPPRSLRVARPGAPRAAPTRPGKSSSREKSRGRAPAPWEKGPSAAILEAPAFARLQLHYMRDVLLTS